MTSTGVETGNRNLTGIGYMLAGVGFLSAMDSVAKALVGTDYSVMQILAIRGWIIVVAMVLILLKLGKLKALKTTQPFKHLLRVMVGFLAPYLFFSSLKVLGLADATVLFFGCGTFLMTALSVPLFKERVGPHRWAAVAVGFIGVLIAAQPSDGVFRIEALYVIASGVSYALMMLATRWLGPSEGTFRQVFYYNLGLMVIATLALPLSFKAMPADDIVTITTMALLAIAGQFGITRAFHAGPVSLLAPFEYTALIWAALLGYFIWSDTPSTNVLIGAAVIISCGLFLIYREALEAKEQKRETSIVVAIDPVVIVASRPGDIESEKTRK